MTGRIGSRLTKIEAMQRGSWTAWAGIPLDKWPDEALHGYLDHALGVSAEAVRTLSNEALEHIAGGGHGPKH